MSEAIYSSVKDYYGKVLEKSDDLKTTACTTANNQNMTASVKKALSLVNEEVHSKYYGCGIVLPPALEGCSVLDLGCGAGRDCFCLSKLVGENGFVTGLDMTEEQLEVAERNIEHHMKTFGYSKTNVEFKKGYIEKLGEAGIKPSSYDVIVSNCVVNLSPDKEAVLTEAYKALKEGGELYFSDVYADRRLSDEIVKHEVLWGECVAGALYWEDLISLAKKVGFTTPLLVDASRINLKNEKLEKVVGDAKFVSATYRLFKIGKNEDESETAYATYKGEIADLPETFKYDELNLFEKNKVRPISGIVLNTIKGSRYSKYFELKENKRRLEVIDPFVISSKSSSSCSKKTPTSGKCCGSKCN